MHGVYCNAQNACLNINASDSLENAELYCCSFMGYKSQYSYLRMSIYNYYTYVGV